MADIDTRKIVQNAAPQSFSILIISIIYCVITLICLLLGIFSTTTLVVGILLLVILVLCYFSTPVAYELTDGCLKIIMRKGSFSYAAVTRCTMAPGTPMFSLRLFGNGGLFAGTGIYWNSTLGIFRAYVTRAGARDLVMIEAGDKKIIISPEDPAAFIGEDTDLT
ncbi:MAG: hypothetical protein JXR78_00995 [Victivallales bacterium]|nr:hypothetical protein [Victivallales bacterium]